MTLLPNVCFACWPHSLKEPDGGSSAGDGRQGSMKEARDMERIWGARRQESNRVFCESKGPEVRLSRAGAPSAQPELAKCTRLETPPGQRP